MDRRARVRGASMFAAALSIAVAGWCGFACGTADDASASGPETAGDSGRGPDAAIDVNERDARAPGQDGEGDARPLGCDSPEVLVCDGFDSPVIASSRWEEETQNGAVAIDTAR